MLPLEVMVADVLQTSRRRREHEGIVNNRDTSEITFPDPSVDLRASRSLVKMAGVGYEASAQ